MVDKELINKFVEWRRGVQTIGQDPVFYYKGKYIIEVSNVDGLDTFIIIRTYNEELDTFETVSNEEVYLIGLDEGERIDEEYVAELLRDYINNGEY